MGVVAAEPVLDLCDPQFLRSAACRTALSHARSTDPVFWHVEDAGTGFWAVLKHADVTAISKDPELFSSAAGVFLYDNPVAADGALLFTDPPEHRRLRRFVTSFFMGRGVSRLEPWIRQECARLIGLAARRGSFDLIGEVASSLPLSTIAQVMALSGDQSAAMLAISDEMAAAGAAGGARAARAIQQMSDFGVALAHERRRDPGDDLVSTMLSVKNSQDAPLSDSEFGMMFMQIAGAATDTTRGVLGGIVLRLAEDPALAQRLRADPDLIDGFIEEVLRMQPPVYYMRRTATRDTVLGGKSIRRGDRVVMYYLSANFDEDVFESPFEFNIERNPNPHLSFGTGEHVCLGLLLARLELRIFVQEWVKRIDQVELTGEPVEHINTESTRYLSIPVRCA